MDERYEVTKDEYFDAALDVWDLLVAGMITEGDFKSFLADTAEELGITPEDRKQIVAQARDALGIVVSRLFDTQKEAEKTAKGQGIIDQIRAGKIRSEDDYHAVVNIAAAKENDPARKQHIRTATYIAGRMNLAIELNGQWCNDGECPACHNHTGSMQVDRTNWHIGLRCRGTKEKLGCSLDEILTALKLTRDDLSVAKHNGKTRLPVKVSPKEFRLIIDKTKAYVANELILAPEAPPAPLVKPIRVVKKIQEAMTPAFTINSYRVALGMFAQVYAKEDQTFPTFVFTPAELGRKFLLKGRLTIEAAKVLVWELGGLNSLMHFGSDWISVQWFDHPKYNDDTGLVTLKLHDDLLPYLTNLKERYTALPVKESAGLTETYHLLLFNLIWSFVWLSEHKVKVHGVPIQDLIGALRIPKTTTKKTYREEFWLFDQNILKPAREAIQKHTGLRFKFRGARVNPHDRKGLVQVVEFYNIEVVQALEGQCNKVKDEKQDGDADVGE
jgi:hypothetical protein